MYDQDALKAELFRDEGYRSAAYKDHLGYWTIGIGRLIDKRRGGGITKDEAYYLLGNDIAKVEEGLDARLPWWREVSNTRQRALLNMAFQLGVSGLMKFKNTLRMAKNGEWDRAARNALYSRWARQTPRRAKRISEMLRKG